MALNIERKVLPQKSAVRDQKKSDKIFTLFTAFDAIYVNLRESKNQHIVRVFRVHTFRRWIKCVPIFLTVAGAVIYDNRFGVNLQ